MAENSLSRQAGIKAKKIKIKRPPGYLGRHSLVSEVRYKNT